MASLLEVLVSCDSINPLWTCSIWDPLTGTNLMTYKGGGTAEYRTLSFIGKDYLAAVEKTKPLLNIWPLNSSQTVQGMRFVLPGRAKALAFTPDGSYCIAGVDEKIYLWQISSGNLLTIISRHYQPIVILKFTPDGRYFISAAEDGMVMVWALTTVAAHSGVELVTQSVAGQHDPVHVFSDHSLPVTDLCVSKAGMNGRLCTVSSDRTCKIYNLCSGEMLLNIVFNVALLSITFDVLELNVFIGTNDGKIHQFCLTNPMRSKDYCIENEDTCPTFSSHTKGVTCLSVSLDGETLMSGSNDELLILWHIRSKQTIRTIRHKGPITNAYFMLNLPSIYTQEFSPNIILHNLQRTLEKDADELTEMEILMKKKINFWPKQNSTVEADLSVKEIELEFLYKETKLKEELQNLRKVNADLYAFSIDKALVTEFTPTVRIECKNKKRKIKQ